MLPELPLIDLISIIISALLAIFGFGYIIAAWTAKEDIKEIKYTCSAILMYVLAYGMA